MQADEEHISLARLQLLLQKLQVTLSTNNTDDIKQSLTTIVDGYTPWKLDQKKARDHSDKVVHITGKR